MNQLSLSQKEILSRLIRAEFDRMSYWSNWKELITLAEDLELDTLAEEMLRDSF